MIRLGSLAYLLRLGPRRLLGLVRHLPSFLRLFWRLFKDPAGRDQGQAAGVGRVRLSDPPDGSRAGPAAGSGGNSTIFCCSSWERRVSSSCLPPKWYGSTCSASRRAADTPTPGACAAGTGHPM